MLMTMPEQSKTEPGKLFPWRVSSWPRRSLGVVRYAQMAASADRMAATLKYHSHPPFCAAVPAVTIPHNDPRGARAEERLSTTLRWEPIREDFASSDILAGWMKARERPCIALLKMIGRLPVQQLGKTVHKHSHSNPAIKKG